MSRIIFISPNRDLSILAQSVAKEIGIQVEFYDGWFEQAGQMVEKLTGPPIDIIISRGGTADYIAKNFKIPVIAVNKGAYDIMECLDEARQYSKNIIITTFNDPLVGLQLLEKVFGISITEINFTSLEELEKRIAELALSGDCCVVGGGPSISYATQCGLPSVFLRTSRATLHAAFLQAEQMAKLRREEARRRYRLQAILDAANEGIIAIDAEGIVEIYNKAAERIFGIAATEIVGKLISECIPSTHLDQVVLSGQAEDDEIQSSGDVHILTNRVAVKNGEEIMGAVATFQELSKVVKAEQKIRKELTGQKSFRAKFNFSDIIGSSNIMAEKKKIAKTISQSNLTVLIYGESGTGKELFAQSIHNASSRATNSFVAVNCGALPPNLLESELFGYEEGAFTGARRKGKYGLFELAHTGTIFLDEIDSLPIEMQGRLLRVLQEREVLRVGGETIIPVDVRIIAATNQHPDILLQQRKIREDLFYRLNVLYLELPALAQHSEDIFQLCESFVPADKKVQIMPLLRQLVPYFEKYNWPGNVRELYNIVQRLSFFVDSYKPGQHIRTFLEIVAPRVLKTPTVMKSGGDTCELRKQIREMEDTLIVEALKDHGTLDKTAAYLGIGRSTLTRKLKEARAKETGNED